MEQQKENKPLPDGRPPPSPIRVSRSVGGTSATVSTMTLPSGINSEASPTHAQAPPLAPPTVSAGDSRPSRMSSNPVRFERQESRGDSPPPVSPRNSSRTAKRSLADAEPAATINGSGAGNPRGAFNDSFVSSVGSDDQLSPSQRNRPRVLSRKLGKSVHDIESDPVSTGDSNRTGRTTSPGAVAVYMSDPIQTDDEVSQFLSIGSGDSPELPPLPTIERIRTDMLVEASLVTATERPIDQLDFEIPSSSDSGHSRMSNGVLVRANPVSKTTVWLTPRVIAAITVVVLIIFAIVVGVLVSGINRGDSSKAIDALNVSDAELGPTQAPTPFVLSDFIEFSLPEYTREDLLNPESSQSAALQWMLSDSQIGTYSTKRKLQRFALAPLYHSTDGEIFWIDDEGWLTESNECDWYTGLPSKNLVCNPDGEFQALNLVRAGLHGEIPREINLLTSLVSIRLNLNDIHGHLPGFENLTQLETISIVDSDLEGPLPTELGSLTKLRSLFLDENYLTGELPSEIFADWTLMRDIGLGGNQLNGTIPEAITGATSLEYLYLDDNSFSGTLPEFLCLLSNLKEISVSSNSFEKTIPSCLGNLSDLVSLNLHHNFFTGEVPNSLCEALESEETDFNEISIDCHLVSCSCDCTCVPTESPSTQQLSDSPSSVPTGYPSMSPAPPREPSSAPVSTAPTRSPTTPVIAPTPAPESTAVRVTKSPTQKPISAPTLRPTIRQTVSPTQKPSTPSSGLSTFLDSLPSSTKTRIKVSSSAQARAFSWLESSPNVETFSNSRLLQRFVLATFYFSTKGETWIEKGGWLTSANECTWFIDKEWLGAPPCEFDGSFGGLVLPDNGLSGSIPDELSLLLSLHTIHLSGNTIGGSIPSGLGNLSLLDWIAFENNGLSS